MGPRLKSNQNFFSFPISLSIYCLLYTNRTVKPFTELVDLFPGFKLEEECFSKAIINDVNPKKKSKSDLNQEPMSWPREKSAKETTYERFLDEAVNPKTGEFYPQRDKDKAVVPKTGATYYITDIYRLRRVAGKNSCIAREECSHSIVGEIL